jgi:tetratricopeptide (TPR) repeat protein
MPRFLAPALAALVALAAPASAQTATSDSVDSNAVATAADSAASAAASAASAAAAARAAARRDSIEALVALRARAQASYEEGSEFLQREDFEGALIRFEDGIAIFPESVGNTYGRAFALAQLGREEEAVVGFQRAAVLAEAVGDTTAVRLANQSREGIISRRLAGVAPVYNQVDGLLAEVPPTREAGEQAVALMTGVEGVALEDVSYHYRWARALNAAERFADAAEHAETAITMSVDESDRSGYFYEFGVALRGMGQVAPARDAFEQARTGAWSAWADYQLASMPPPADG